MKKKLILSLSAVFVILSATACQSKKAAITETTAVMAETTIAIDDSTDAIDESTTAIDELTTAINESTVAKDESTVINDETTVAETIMASINTESEVAAKNSLVEQLEQSDYKGFAKDLKKIISEKDITSLADHTLYPIYVTTKANPNGILVDDKDSFLAMADDIFTDELLSVLETMDTETLTTVQAGVMIGFNDSKVGTIVGIDESGKLGIVSISSIK